MNLEEFTIKLHEDANIFYNEWKKNQKEQPKHYPKKLTEDEWYEQYLAWFTGV